MVLTSYFDVALNKHNAGQGSVLCICVSMHRFNVLRLSIDYSRTSNVFADVKISAKNHNFNIPLILGKFNIMIIMQQKK